MRRILAFTMGATLLFSCTKETSSTPSAFDVANVNNPLDSVGVLHNEITDHLVTTYDTGSIHTHIDQYFANDSRFEDSIPSETYWNNLYNNCYIESTNEFVYENYLNNLGMEVINEQLILEVLSLGETYDGTNVKDVINTIKNHENIALSTYASTDISNYLATSSVLRHSLYYWDDYVGTNVHKFSFKKIGTGICDAIGGAEGYYTGQSSTNKYSGIYTSIKNAATASVAGSKALHVL